MSKKNAQFIILNSLNLLRIIIFSYTNEYYLNLMLKK